MKVKIRLLILGAFASKASAFVAPSAEIKLNKVTCISGSEIPDSGRILDLSKEGLENFGSLKNKLDDIKVNIFEGELGKRGEEWCLAQSILVLCILFGVPVIGSVLKSVVGPILLLGGLLIILASLSDLGTSLSPWVEPPKQGVLIRNGIFSKVRHPIYAGLLVTMTGFSILMDSLLKLILTGVLFYILDMKSKQEEKLLIKKFGQEYLEYMNEVPAKFIPDDFLKRLPKANDNTEVMSSYENMIK